MMADPQFESSSSAPASIESDAEWGAQWQTLPKRAFHLSLMVHLVVSATIAVLALIPIGVLLGSASPALPLALTLLIALPAFGAWLARKQYRYIQWRWDMLGFSVRRGRLWHSDVCVPAARVQHLDLKRGPLERRFGLATLVIHTAGTRDEAVSISGLDAAIAEQLRDVLAQRTNLASE